MTPATLLCAIFAAALVIQLLRLIGPCWFDVVLSLALVTVFLPAVLITGGFRLVRKGFCVLREHLA